MFVLAKRHTRQANYKFVNIWGLKFETSSSMALEDFELEFNQWKTFLWILSSTSQETEHYEILQNKKFKSCLKIFSTQPILIFCFVLFFFCWKEFVCNKETTFSILYQVFVRAALSLSCFSLIIVMTICKTFYVT